MEAVVEGIRILVSTSDLCQILLEGVSRGYKTGMPRHDALSQG
jgi:hypothetical protein